MIYNIMPDMIQNIAFLSPLRGFGVVCDCVRRLAGVLPKVRQHVLKQQGKAYKVVQTACTRKLLTTRNVMMRNQTPWTPKLI